jgi:hypothetical protein
VVRPLCVVAVVEERHLSAVRVTHLCVGQVELEPRSEVSDNAIVRDAVAEWDGLVIGVAIVAS